MTHSRNNPSLPALLPLGLTALLGALVACSGLPPADPEDGDPLTDPGGDDGGGDPAVGELPEGVTVTPAPGESLPWNGCLELTMDDPLVDLRASATDDTGASWALFAGALSDVGVVMPTHAWPPGHVVDVELTWDGGSAVLSYPVEDLVPAQASPAGTGIDASLGGTPCPDSLNVQGVMDAMTVVLPDYSGLVEVLSYDPVTGAAEVRFGFSASGSPDQHPTMETYDATGVYADPLLTITAIPPLLPWPGFPEAIEHAWGGAQLAGDGLIPVASAFGVLAELDTLEDDFGLLGICDDLAFYGAPWCGACPHDHGETCIYGYLRDMPLDGLAAPLVEIDHDGVVIW